MNAAAKFNPVEIPEKITIGQLIEIKRENQNQIDQINTALKEANKYKQELDSRLITLMEKEGQTKASTDLMSIVITEERRPQVTDWDTFIQHAVETDSVGTFFQRRLNVKPCKEIWDGGADIPGVDVFTEAKVNFRRK